MDVLSPAGDDLHVPSAHQCHMIRPLPWLAFGNGLESPRCSRAQVFPMGLF